MKYKVILTSRFKKDIKLAKKQNRNIGLLLEVVDKLSNGEQLEPKYRDHALVNCKGIRDYHIESDWVLLYEYRNEMLILLLHRIGSHSDLSL